MLDKPKPNRKGMSNMEFPPFGSRTIYKPLLLITSITCLKHFSGVSFTKKFLLQILAPKSKDGDPRLPTLFAIGITTIRLFANLYMAKLIKKTRLRFLFFFSLFMSQMSQFVLKCVKFVINGCQMVSKWFQIHSYPSPPHPNHPGSLAAPHHPGLTPGM